MDETPDITLREIRARLAEQSTGVAISTLWRFFRRRGIMRKKTAHAAEQDRPDVVKRRQEWLEGQIDPEHLVFIDET